MFTERCGTGTWRGEEFMQHWPRFVEGGQILGLAIATTYAEMTRPILGLAKSDTRRKSRSLEPASGPLPLHRSTHPMCRRRAEKPPLVA